MTPLDIAILCAFVAGVASTLTLVVVALYLRTCVADYRARGPEFALRTDDETARQVREASAAPLALVRKGGRR